MCVVFCSFLFLILQDFHECLNNIPEQCVVEVIIGQCGQPQEISIEFYQDLIDQLNPPGDSPFFGDRFRIKKPICCEHPLGGGFKFQIFLYFSPLFGEDSHFD